MLDGNTNSLVATEASPILVITTHLIFRLVAPLFE
jgi:hypothetical protein